MPPQTKKRNLKREACEFMLINNFHLLHLINEANKPDLGSNSYRSRLCTAPQ